MREQLVLPEPIEPQARTTSRSTRRRAGVFLSTGLALAIALPNMSACGGDAVADEAKAEPGNNAPGRAAQPAPTGGGARTTAAQETPHAAASTTDATKGASSPAASPSVSHAAASSPAAGPLNVECSGFTKETGNGFVTLTPQVTVSGSLAGKTINTVVNAWGPEGDNLYMGRGIGAPARVPESVFSGAIVTGVTVVVFNPGQEPAADHLTKPLSSLGVPERNVIPCGEGIAS